MGAARAGIALLLVVAGLTIATSGTAVDGIADRPVIEPTAGSGPSVPGGDPPEIGGGPILPGPDDTSGAGSASSDAPIAGEDRPDAPPRVDADGTPLERPAGPGVLPDRAADSDGDGLPDPLERQLGTDPTAVDTDGDGLPDPWEVEGETPDGVPLPDADPLRMDLYVQVYYAAGVRPLSDADERIVRAAFAAMPVDNPDGTTGIAVHLDDGPPGGRLNESIVVRDRRAVERFEGRFYTREYLGDRRGVYRQLLLVEVAPGAGFTGAATTPGRVALVDAGATRPYSGTIPYRDRAIVHELLHNVLGELDPDVRAPGDPTHSKRGWLTHRTQRLGRHEYLPAAIAERIEREGFAG